MNYTLGKNTGIILPLSIFILLLLSACSYTPIFSPRDIDSEVTITDSRRTIEFTPSSGAIPEMGLLFYPGGLVDSHVYDEFLAGFTSASGINTVVVKMPANLAVLSIDSGLRIIDDYTEITEWVIAGHSLGGAMPASTVKKHPTAYKWLILMDSYPTEGDNLIETDHLRRSYSRSPHRSSLSCIPDNTACRCQGPLAHEHRTELSARLRTDLLRRPPV